MKRIFVMILMLLLLSGCTGAATASSVTFYYPRASFEYNAPDGILAPEVRSHGGNTSTAYLLDQYLDGPLDEKLVNPFPADASLISVHIVNNTVFITVSDTMAQLSGAPLILACACLGRTGMELSDTKQAHIQCSSLLLDGKTSIIVSEDTFFYNDSYHPSYSEVE